MSTEAIRRIEEIKNEAARQGYSAPVGVLCDALAIAVKALQDYRTMPRLSAHNGVAASTLTQIEEVLK